MSWKLSPNRRFHGRRLLYRFLAVNDEWWYHRPHCANCKVVVVAVAVGAAIYLASAATRGTALTTDSDTGSNELVGYAIEAKGAVAGNVKVRINN